MALGWRLQLAAKLTWMSGVDIHVSFVFTRDPQRVQHGVDLCHA
jgi:hypothetical protein